MALSNNYDKAIIHKKSDGEYEVMMTANMGALPYLLETMAWFTKMKPNDEYIIVDKKDIPSYNIKVMR